MSQQFKARDYAAQGCNKLGAKVIVTDTINVNPRIDNTVKITFTLAKFSLGLGPGKSDFIFRYKLAENGNYKCLNMNSVIEAMPVKLKEQVPVELFIPANMKFGAPDKVYFDLVDRAERPDVDLVCYGSTVVVNGRPINK